MAVGRVWDADNGVWQRIGGPPNVVDAVEPASPVDGLIWTNPTDGVSKIWDADGDEWIGVSGGGEHVVDPVEPVTPTNGLLWTNPDEINVADPSQLPKGVLGYAQKTTNQGSILGTEVDIAGLSVTVTMAASRRIKITAKAGAYSTVAGDIFTGAIYEGTTMLSRFFQNDWWSGVIVGQGSAIVTPSTGLHTYKMVFYRNTGTGTITVYADAANPAFILVEDIGAV